MGWLMYVAHMFRDVVMVGAFLIPGTSLPDKPDASGVASRFGDPGDKWIGGTLKCKPKERVSTKEHQCAHRYYKCGTILIVENKRNGKRSWCEVADRGPYGANVFLRQEKRLVPVYSESGRKAWYVKKRKSHDPPDDLCPSGNCVGRWRGIVDLSPAVSDAIGHNGFERVNLYRADNLTRWQERRRRVIAAWSQFGYSLESLLAAR